jgi:hypothetical protein
LGKKWDYDNHIVTLQKRITLIPLFIKNLINWEASDMEDRLPSAGISESIGGGFQIM